MTWPEYCIVEEKNFQERQGIGSKREKGIKV
jgi:hypothetical protein